MNEKDVLNGFESIATGDETGMFDDYGDTLTSTKVEEDVDMHSKVCDTD